VTDSRVREIAARWLRVEPGEWAMSDDGTKVVSTRRVHTHVERRLDNGSTGFDHYIQQTKSRVVVEFPLSERGEPDGFDVDAISHARDDVAYLLSVIRNLSR
jgi:hypothetical protein